MKRENVIPLNESTELFQRYTIRKMLAAGGFGITYLAEDSMGSRYVIKEHYPAWYVTRNKSGQVIPLEKYRNEYKWSMGLFLKEASQLSVLNHPHIVHLVDAFEENGTAYYAMPYLNGGDLAQVIRCMKTEHKSLSQATVLNLLRRMLEALEHMHSRSLRDSSTPIYHLDIKPANLLFSVSADGLEVQPVLIDFGNPDMATPGYVPHEQRVDSGKGIGPWTDIYSLAATIHMLLLGTPPPPHISPDGQPLTSQPQRHLLAQNKTLTQRYDLELLESLDKALEWEPEKRFANATEWLKILSGIPLRIPDHGSTLRDFTRREKKVSQVSEGESKNWLLSLCLAAMLICGAILWYMLSGDAQENADSRTFHVDAESIRKMNEDIDREEQLCTRFSEQLQRLYDDIQTKQPMIAEAALHVARGQQLSEQSDLQQFITQIKEQIKEITILRSEIKSDAATQAYQKFPEEPAQLRQMLGSFCSSKEISPESITCDYVLQLVSWDAALASAQRTLEVEKKQIEADYLQGNAYYEGSNGYTQDYQKAVSLYKKSAEKGFAQAQSDLGLCYHNGTGIDKNPQEAYNWFNKAAQQGNAYAQYYLAVCYQQGEGVTQNLTEALRWYRAAAEQGIAQALNKLGDCYEEGIGMEQKDEQAALECYRKAAELNDAEGLYHVGRFYSYGIGVHPDPEKAFEYFTQAAEKDYDLAQIVLGKFYERGFGGKKNEEQAFYWYNRAANKNAEGQYLVGCCYKEGIGVSKDLLKAFKWFERAATPQAGNNQGYAIAQTQLGDCYRNGTGVKKNVKEAFNWYSRAAEQNYAEAQYKVACCYYHGLGVKLNYDKAVEWLQRAANQQNANAQFLLGRCYCFGHGVPINPELGRKWVQKAAEHGNKDAQTMFESYY